MTLYHIQEEIKRCMEDMDEETGELLNVERLDALVLKKEEKIEQIACWVKNLKADAEALDKEKKSFEKRQKQAKNKVEQLERYLSNTIAGEKYDFEKAKISWIKSESVEVLDLEALSEDYYSYQSPTVNKAKVKEALKAGIALNGVRLVEKQNIQIK